MIDYLNSLIELEFSVVRDYIKNTDRIALAELEIYRKIAIYNICNRALHIFNKEKDLIISGNNDGFEGLTVYANTENNKITLFDFNYRKNDMGLNYTVPDGYKQVKIGTISLFQTLESESIREAELNLVMSKLERLYDEKNPYIHSRKPKAFGGPSSIWEFKHKQEIIEYEKRFAELDSKKSLTDDEKKEIEITKKYHDILFEDYDLSRKSFSDAHNKPFSSSNRETNLNKTLIKRMPNLTITDNIKYI